VTLLALIALGFIIVTGGAVRLTGSGLGCPQWPRCAGGRLVAPDSFHPMVEFVNRVVTGAVSVAVIVAALGAFLLRPRRRDLCVLGLGLVAGLVGQIVLGGLTVQHRLEPGYVMAHFLLSMTIVWVAVVLHHRASGIGLVLEDRSERALGRLMVVMAAMTIVIGTVVTGAGPHSGANSGDGVVARWQIDLHRITQLHGISAMLLVGLVLVCFALVRSSGSDLVVGRCRNVIEALGFQVAIGYTQYFTGVPPLLVGFHLLGAALVWVSVLRFALVAGRVAVAVPDLVAA
jgi:cytochrome c oxidase assembly protein subunit 15